MTLKCRRIRVHIQIMHTYLNLTSPFPISYSIVVRVLLLDVPQKYHCFSTLPKRLTDWLTEKMVDSGQKKTPSPIVDGRQNLSKLENITTCCTCTRSFVAPLIFDGTVRTRDVDRLTSIALGRGGYDPIFIEALPFPHLASLVTAL